MSVHISSLTWSLIWRSIGACIPLVSTIRMRRTRAAFQTRVVSSLAQTRTWPKNSEFRTQQHPKGISALRSSKSVCKVLAHPAGSSIGGLCPPPPPPLPPPNPCPHPMSHACTHGRTSTMLSHKISATDHLCWQQATNMLLGVHESMC